MEWPLRAKGKDSPENVSLNWVAKVGRSRDVGEVKKRRSAEDGTAERREKELIFSKLLFPNLHRLKQLEIERRLRR